MKMYMNSSSNKGQVIEIVYASRVPPAENNHCSEMVTAPCKDKDERPSSVVARV
jgi:hypothetical protein